MFSNPPENIHPIDLRQFEIEQHQIGSLSFKGLQADLSINRRHDLIPHGLQSVPQDGGNIRIVFDD